jgi:hypothetical protein
MLLAAIAVLPLWPDSDTAFRGFTDITYAFRVQDPYDQVAAKSRFRPELEAYAGDVAMFVSLDAVYSSLIPSHTGIALKEAYVDYFGDRFDLRLGRQIVVWGKADGFSITDIVSPKDYGRFVGVEYEDTRLAVDGVRLRYLGNVFCLEGIWIPSFAPSLLPEDPANPLTASYPEEADFGSGIKPVNYTVVQADAPVAFLDSEAALRASVYLPLMDFSLSFFSGWDDEAAVRQTLVTNAGNYEITVEPEYYRIWMAGIDAAVPAGSVVLRTEAALIGDRRFTRDDPFEVPVKKSQLKALAGVDWNPGYGWSLTAQYAEDWVLDYDQHIAREERKPSATFSISKSLLRETLELSAAGSIGCRYGDGYASVGTDYALTDELHLSLGSEIYWGGKDGEGEYADYADLTCVWIRGRYSF